MFETLFADGIASGLSEKVATFLIKCLAVGGGFLVGYFLGAAVAWALDRWVFAQKAPPQLKKLVSLAAAVALALVVALIVFGEGGDGLFGGRGNQGEGKGTPTPDEKGKTPPNSTVPPKQDEIPPKKNEPGPQDTRPTPGDVHIAILSGDEVREGRFYLIEGDPVPKTFDELRDAIAAKRKATNEELTLVFRFKTAQLSNDHPAVRRLDAWTREAKLKNRFE